MGIFFVIVAAFLLFPRTAIADSEVSIESNVSSSYNSTSETESTTDIRIEHNGVVKEYHGTGDQNIRVESEDGKSTVTVDNQTISLDPTPTVVPFTDPSPPPFPSPLISPQVQGGTGTHFNMLDFLEEKFKVITRILVINFLFAENVLE